MDTNLKKSDIWAMPRREKGAIVGAISYLWVLWRLRFGDLVPGNSREAVNAYLDD